MPPTTLGLVEGRPDPNEPVPTAAPLRPHPPLGATDYPIRSGVEGSSSSSPDLPDSPETLHKPIRSPPSPATNRRRQEGGEHLKPSRRRPSQFDGREA